MKSHNLRVVPARMQDYAAIERFYLDVIDVAVGTSNDPLWEWGVHPCEADLRAAIESRTLLLAWEGGAPASPHARLAAALILNGECAPGYSDVAWVTPAKPHEVAVLHLFAVHPSCAGRGVARAVLAEVQAVARERGAKVMRFDCIAGNEGARLMYERCGFTCCGPATLAYPDAPDVCDFTMFEKAL